MEQLRQILESMEPSEALEVLLPHLKNILANLDEEARIRLVNEMVGGPGADKVSSMVDLWLAECMGEGVDPTNMCQSLVQKVAQSKQLMAVAEPDILVLFESWLAELEEEVLYFLKKNRAAEAVDIASSLGLSKSGAEFLLAKLAKEGKLGEEYGGRQRE